MATSFASILRFSLISILIHYYSQEEFGLWASITSLAAIIVTNDFGIVNVLRNLLSKEAVKGKEGDKKAKELFYSAFFSFLLFSFIVSVLIIFISPYIPYELLFKTDNEVLKEQGKFIFVVVQILFLIRIPFGLGSPLFFSYGETKIYSYLSILEAILSFVIVLFLSINHIKIHIVSIVYFSCSIILSIYGTLLFLHRRKWYRINVSYKTMYKNMRMMLPVGLKFLGIQLTSSFISNALTIYSGSMLGLSTAATVNVIQKIYMFFIGIYQSIFNPIWSSLSLNYFTNKYSECKKIINRSLVSTIIIFSILISICCIFRNYIVYLITGTEEYNSNFSLFLLIGIFFMSKLVFDNSSLLHNATNRLNILIIGYIIFGSTTSLLVPHLISYYDFSITLIFYIICWILFIIIILNDVNRLLKEKLFT